MLFNGLLKLNFYLYFLLFTANLSAQIKLNMYKMSNPPIENASAFNDVWGYEDTLGNEFAIIGTASSIRIYDVTDPRSPNKVFDFSDGTNTSWRDFKTYKNYLYAVCDNCTEGLEYISMDSLATGVVHQDLSHFTRAHNIFVDTLHARLYAVGYGNGIYVYDVSTPSNPTFLKYFNDNKYVHDINVVDNIAYASCGYDGTYVYDFTNINNITTLMYNEYPKGSIYHHSSTKCPDMPYVYSANEVPGGEPIVIYKIKNNNLIIANTFKDPLLAPAVTNSRPHNPFVHENKIFISYYHDGLQVFDMADPENPKKCAYYDTYLGNTNYNGYEGNWGVYPYLRSGTILASDISTGLYVLGLDIKTTIQEPTLLATNGSGLIVRDKNNGYKITVDNAGLIVITTVAHNQSASNKLIYSDLSVAGDLILTSPNGSHYALHLNNAGSFYTSFVSSLPIGDKVTITGDFSFEDIFTGPQFTNVLGRYKLTCKAGNLVAHFIE